MKVQACVVLSFQAKTLTEAGAMLDDVLVRPGAGGCRRGGGRARQSAR